MPFNPKNEFLFQIWDDDSSLLFVSWAAWLKRNLINVDPASVEKAWSFVKTHVVNDFHLTPAQPFCYWADTVQFDTPERVAHNQGLYALAARSMLEHGWGNVVAADYDRARARYAEFFRPDFGFMTLGKDSWWADKIDISVLFPEFLLRWLYQESALPDEVIRSTVDRYLPLASVYKQDKTLAGCKVICAPDGSFLPPAAVRSAQPERAGPISERRLLAHVHPHRAGAALQDRTRQRPEDAHRNAGANRARQRSPLQRDHHSRARRGRRD